MTDPREFRPFPRWLHAWAVLTALFALVVLVVGGLVTTFRVGMSDPVWPTEPWFLAINGWTEPQPGFLIEHTHRLVAFSVGGLAIVLSLGLWWTHPNRPARVVGLLGLLVLIGAFGRFHGQMMAQRDPSVDVKLPMDTLGAMGGGLGVALLVGAGGLLLGSRGAGTRLLGVVALVAVMVQGLLGGFRVRLDVWFGPDLAMFHGVFAQVVFGLLACLAALTAKRSLPEEHSPEVRRAHRAALLLVALIYIQIAWGALVRHAGTPLSLRMHFLTAFLVTGAAVWLLRSLFAARRPAGAWVLTGILALQVALGVEAWMGKFGSGIHVDLQTKLSRMEAAIRTSHLAVGSVLLGTAVVLWVRTKRVRVPVEVRSDVRDEWGAGRGELAGVTGGDSR